MIKTVCKSIEADCKMIKAVCKHTEVDCKMAKSLSNLRLTPNRIVTVQECDATEVHSSNADRLVIK
jgi:hypothetical protein